MTSQVVVRRADLEDVPALARVHVASWRETYRGVMRDEVLDDPELVESRERFWTVVISGEGSHDRTIVLAEADGDVVGMALAGPPSEDDATWTRQLYVLYTLRAVHGSGAGAALLAAVLDPDAPAALWVADPNPRAQAFYRRQGFVPDGTSKVDDGVHAIRMVRSPTESGPER
ncbi:N-acetyltransferase family protein [Cellulomonas sp. URHB0016]